jgi:nitrogen fixation protein NifX
MSGFKLRLLSGHSVAESVVLRVALATRDNLRVDAHFGSASRFSIYDVTPEHAHFVEAVIWNERSDETGTHDKEVDRIGPKVQAIHGCDLLFCLAIGGPAAAKVIASRIHPIKLGAPEAIDDVLTKVQNLMTSGEAPPWLRKVLLARTKRSMDYLDEEEVQ